MILIERIVLGDHMSYAGIKVYFVKIEVIVKLETPTSQKDVGIFLGHAGYYRIFHKNLTKETSPLFKFLAKDVVFHWNEDCQHAFESLNKKLCSYPILRGSNWTFPFHISTDALDKTIVGVLCQKEVFFNYAIYFIRKNMTPTKLNYIVTKNKFLVDIYAINKFRHYITRYEVYVHTGHSAIKYLMNNCITIGRVTRCLLLLQEFNDTILDRPGKQNLVVDFLSRVNNEGEINLVE